MNSVIQALVSLPSTVSYLRDRVVVYYSPLVPMPMDGSDKKPLHVTEALLDLAVGKIPLHTLKLLTYLFPALNDMDNKRRVLKPGILMQALETVKKSNRKLLCYEQQDAHELLALVSGHLSDEELPRPSVTTSLFNISSLHLESPNSNSQIIKASATTTSSLPHHSQSHRHLTQSLKNPLTGLMAGIMTCTRCSYKSAINCAIFNNISLAVPTVAQVSIEQLLQTYITPEPIHDYVCDKCSLVATAKTIEMKALKVKAEIEAIKNSSASNSSSSSVSPSSASIPSTSSKKKKTKKSALSPVLVNNEITSIDAAKLKELVATMVELEKDRQIVVEAAKYNVEATLPKHIKLTKSVSPLTTKQIVIATPPRSLCLHMQRSVFLPSGHSYKNNSRVVFGEYLDIGRFCLNSSAGPGSEERKTAGGWADLMMSSAKTTTFTSHPKQTSTNEIDAPPPLSVVNEPEGVKRGGLIGGSGLYNPGYASVLSNMNQQAGISGSIQDIRAGISPYPYLYRLHAVVIHYGGHDSGHFVTYRRSPHPLSKEFKQMGLSAEEGEEVVLETKLNESPTSKSKNRKRKQKAKKTAEAGGDGNEPPARWFRISDERVDVVKNVSEEVFMHASQHAYMLFYERVLTESV
ncbi:UNVERIFIED_CONTAM: hypothetical protein HDU68_002228 [Siphonaria sp. JEL0065]|nr:hypothetical protein HDU68_002228 [Siphonaria sp. JEL0065]